MADRQRRETTTGGNVFGAAILGAVAGATAMFLSDPSNRKKVKDKANKLISDGKDTLEEAGDVTRRKAVKKLEEAKQKVEKK